MSLRNEKVIKAGIRKLNAAEVETVAGGSQVTDLLNNLTNSLGNIVDEMGNVVSEVGETALSKVDNALDYITLRLRGG
mgnify:FL=1